MEYIDEYIKGLRLRNLLEDKQNADKLERTALAIFQGFLASGQVKCNPDGVDEHSLIVMHRAIHLAQMFLEELDDPSEE